MDETTIKVCGQWKYLYCAVEKEGNTIDFLSRTKRDSEVARRFCEKAIDQNGIPEKVTIDGCLSNLAALHNLNAVRETAMTIRNTQCLNNIVEQDHRAIKRIVNPMPGFKNFRCATILLGGIELMHMIATEQYNKQDTAMSPAQQFDCLAPSVQTKRYFDLLRFLT